MDDKGKYLSVVLLFILSVLTAVCTGQGPVSDKRYYNSVQVEGATAVYIGMFSLNYERQFVLGTGVKGAISAGAGSWYFLPVIKYYHGISLPVSFNILIGKRNNYFEADAGLRYTFLNKHPVEDINEIFPVFNIGYRYQKSDNKGLIFRLYLGLSGVGIGIGKPF